MSFPVAKNLLLERLKGSVGCLRETKDSWNVKTPASSSCLEWDDAVDMRTPITKFVWAATTPLVGSPANRLFSWQWDDHHHIDVEEFTDGEKSEGQGSPSSRENDKDDERSENTGDYSEADDVFTSPKIPIKDLDSDTVCNLGLGEWDNLVERIDKLQLSARKLDKEFSE